MSTSHLSHQQNEKLAGCICATGAVKLYWFMKVLNALFTIQPFSANEKRDYA